MTTKHTCGGPTFGRLAAEGVCPRCDELRHGAAPVQWGATKRAQRDASFRAQLAAHDCKRAGCAVVCTFGDY